MDRTCRLCFLLCLVVGCFGGVAGVWEGGGSHPYVDPVDRDQPWSSIEVTVIVGPGREECFHQRVKEGIKFQLNYHASSKDVHSSLRVLVRTETGERVYASYVALEDEFETEVKKDAIYTICFGNQASRRHDKKVAMTINMLNEVKIKEYFRLKEETEGHLVNASYTVQRTWRHVWRISREQHRLRLSTQRDEAFMANNADYIFYWSVAQAAIIMTAGAIQVWALRNLFNVKVLTPSQKPRC